MSETTGSRLFDMLQLPVVLYQVCSNCDTRGQKWIRPKVTRFTSADIGKYGSPGGTFLLITYYLLLITYHLLLITYYLLLITYYLLLITYHIIYHPYNGGKLQIYIPCNSRSCSSSCSSSIFVVDVAVFAVIVVVVVVVVE